MEHFKIFIACLFLIIGCSKMDEVIVLPLEIEGKASNARDGEIGMDCSIDTSLVCKVDETKIDICFTCELCKTDNAFAERKYVEILIEGLPERTGRPMGEFKLDENYSMKTSFCVTPIPNQMSHIISFNLVETDSVIMSDNIIFNNIDLVPNTENRISRTITKEDIISTSSCDFSSSIFYSEDPNLPGVREKNFYACIIGSYGDCNSVGFDNDGNWEETLTRTMKSFNDDFSAFDYSTPCSGIYIQFQD